VIVSTPPEVVLVGWKTPAEVLVQLNIDGS